MPIEKNKISFTVDLTKELDELEVKKGDRKKASLEAGREALRQIKEYTSNAQSPVKSQRSFKGLSEKYSDFKRKQGQPAIPNLRLNFKMLNSLEVTPSKKGFTVSIKDRKEKLKAYNHNTIKDKINKLPKRQFIPDENQNQEFKREIRKEYLKKLESFSRKQKD